MPRAALRAVALLVALAPSAGASLQAAVDPGGLVLTDVSGSADDATLSSNKSGIFAAVAEKANALGPPVPRLREPEVPRLPVRAPAGAHRRRRRHDRRRQARPRR